MTQAQQRLKKFKRDPTYASRRRNRQITDRALTLIATIERYRVIPTSLVVKLAGGDPRNTSDHLHHLYHKGLVNRFCFFGRTGRPGEFNYFLDNTDALELLVTRTHADPDTLDFAAVRRNRQKWTPLLDPATDEAHSLELSEAAPAAEDASEGQRLFLKHELMISRFHGMLELATRASGGQVKLTAWFQGPILHRYVEAPKIVLRSNDWHEQDGTEKIPHRPDALFTLQRRDNPEPLHFFYEADRKTTNTRRMIKKLRGHFHYIAKARRQQEDYGILRIRAVLTETLDTRWAEALRTAAQHPVVSGPKPSALFWFTASEFFTKRIPKPEGKRMRQVPYYLEHPDCIFRPLWFTPVDVAGAAPRSLLDS